MTGSPVESTPPTPSSLPVSTPLRPRRTRSPLLSPNLIPSNLVHAPLSSPRRPTVVVNFLWRATSVDYHRVPQKTYKGTNLPLNFGTAVTESTVKGEEFEGYGVGQDVMTTYPDNPSSFKYEGQQVFEGTILGKKGSFAMSTVGVSVGGHAKATWTIIPETCTGELKGMKGHGSYTLSCGEHDNPLEIDVPAELVVAFS